MNDLRVVNLSTYTSPVISEKTNQDFVSYGEDNNYFQYLIDRYNGSPTNNAIINGVSEMIYGRGLDATNSSKKPEQYAQMISLFHKDCVRKLCFDLKLMGSCAMQVIYSKDRSKIARVEHMPVETLRAEKCNDKGEIEAYYYHPDWSKQKRNDVLTRIPVFNTSKESIEIIYVKPYRAGYKYYSSVDYQGGLQYAELEEEVSNYHLNNIMNGLAPSMLINFNNGTPNQEERQMIENRIYQKFSGSSNAGKFILAFNDNAESAASIEPVQLSDAHNQYQFLSEESSKKIMVSHRVVSPMLLGIKDNSGLGNNAEELKTASTLMDNMVIRPFQTLLIDAFDQILAFNSISLNLYFKTLQPLEFTDLENVEDEETKEEETGVKLNKQCNCIALSKDLEKAIDNVADELIKYADEDLSGWIIIDESDVDYEAEEELDTQINNLNNPKEKLSTIQKIVNLVSTGTANPNAKSEQDKKIEDDYYKVRYRYVGSKSPERAFCKKMMSANKLYRKEDIIRMGNIPVNKGFGIDGADTYSIWLYKGSVNCKHKWRRVTFKSETKTIDTKSPLAPKVSTNKAEKEGYIVRNPKEVSMMPNDMKDGGAYPKN